MKHDPRWCDPEFIETKEDGSKILMMYSPKPSIPLISRRQMIMQIYTIKDHGGPGRHLEVARSVEHPSKPEDTGMFADVRAFIEVIGILVEKNPNGEGSRMTELRSIDLRGNIPGPAVQKAS